MGLRACDPERIPGAASLNHVNDKATNDNARPPDDLCDRPLELDALAGAVVITGPDGVALAMTPEAAALSAGLLMKAVARARKAK